MESLAKILEFVGKYAWAVCVTAAFLLFIPDDAARQIGVAELRTTFKGALWIVLVLTLVVAIGAILQYIDHRLFDGWLKNRREARAKAEERQREAEAQAAVERKKVEERENAQREAIESLALRLHSLDLNEQMWVKYCLFHNVQTLSAERGNRTAQSLHHKGIIKEGSGHMLDLPFHMPDRVWKYLIEHKDEFLPEAERADTRFPGALANFRKSLWANY
ncbi:super-infection exclusion protein B [Polaromonas sp.]|uniref:super-infection exclusion protein B n=1 Tax=Polaromonas sp. TaxID=1869339 RepID=UPI003CA0E483